MLPHLNEFQKEKMIREVQTTKNGVAIFPASIPAQEALINRMDALESYLSTHGNRKVKKLTNHAAYLLTSIPRSYIGFNGISVENIPIKALSVAEALMGLANIQLINVFEPQGSNTAQFSHHKDWTALYPEGSILARKLPLFGVYVPAKKLIKKTKMPQCEWCFG